MTSSVNTIGEWSDKRLHALWTTLEKWVHYSQRYLFNAIPDT